MSEPSKDKEKDDPSGQSVLPGVYKVRVSYGAEKDSAMVNVLPDPRLNISMEDLAENQAFKREVAKNGEAISKVADGLRNAKKEIGLIEAQLAEKERDEWKEAKEKVKMVKDSLEAVRFAIWGKEDVKGYYEQHETWMTQAGNASYLLSSNLGAIGQNEKHMAEQFRKKTEETVALANKFFSKDWPSFTSYFEQNPISLFEAITVIELD